MTQLKCIPFNSGVFDCRTSCLATDTRPLTVRPFPAFSTGI